jgi:hypothetical protein
MTTDRPSALGVARLRTVAFAGIAVKDVDVQVQISAGLPAFTVVGLPDKAVAESRERVQRQRDRLARQQALVPHPNGPRTVAEVEITRPAQPGPLGPLFDHLLCGEEHPS